jgi:hypothetical protein
MTQTHIPTAVPEFVAPLSWPESRSEGLWGYYPFHAEERLAAASTYAFCAYMLGVPMVLWLLKGERLLRTLIFLLGRYLCPRPRIAYRDDRLRRERPEVFLLAERIS